MPALDLDSLLSLLSAVSAPSTTSLPVRCGGPSASTAEVTAAVQHVAQELLGSQMSADESLMEVALDSLGAVEFRSRLSSKLSDVSLPETLIFEYPTLRQVEAHVHDIVRTISVEPALPRASGEMLMGATSLRQFLSHHAVAPAPLPSTPALPPRAPAAVQSFTRLDLTKLSASLVMASKADSAHPTLVRRRPPRISEGHQNNLVIIHSFLGDDAGYERLWQMSLANHAIYAIQHAALVTHDLSAIQGTATSMLEGYAAALVTELKGEAFALVGASYGSMVAHNLAHVAQAFGSQPSRLILLDPWPQWPASNLSLGVHDYRSAAKVLMVMRAAALGGVDPEDAEFQAKIEDELAPVPSDALGLFLAAKLLPTNASAEEMLAGAHRMTRKILAVMDSGEQAAALLAGVRPFYSPSGEPVVMMVLASGRRKFYEAIFGVMGLEDSLDGYGSVAMHLHVEGSHLDVCNRCSANLVPEFTEAVGDWLTPPVTPAPPWAVTHSTPRAQGASVTQPPHAVDFPLWL